MLSMRLTDYILCPRRFGLAKGPLHHRVRRSQLQNDGRVLSAPRESGPQTSNLVYANLKYCHAGSSIRLLPVAYFGS